MLRNISSLPATRPTTSSCAEDVGSGTLRPASPSHQWPPWPLAAVQRRCGRSLCSPTSDAAASDLSDAPGFHLPAPFAGPLSDPCDLALPPKPQAACWLQRASVSMAGKLDLRTVESAGTVASATARGTNETPGTSAC